MNNPLVSIIIPTYNRAHLIVETLDSVWAQTYTYWECIIVDDGSTDNTTEIVNNYVKNDIRFQYHNRPKSKPKGANACRNFGFDLSKGEVIIFLDSDDLISVDCILNRIKRLSSNALAGLLINDVVFLDKQNQILNKDPSEIKALQYLKMFIAYDIPWQTTAATYKRSYIKQIKFDEDLQRFQDVSFNIKVLSQENVEIIRDYKVDTIYRKEYSRIEDVQFQETILEALIIFLEIHSLNIISKKMRRFLHIFIYKTLEDFVFLNYKKNKKKSNKVFKYLLKSKIYSFNQRTLLLVKWGILYFDLISLKRIGVYRFEKLFRKQIISD